MVIGISTMVYGREELFKKWAENVLKTFGNIPVSVACSEEHYKEIIKGFGFIPVFSENDPLGAKANDSVRALKGKVDYVITTGSDDFFSKNAKKVYKDNFKYDFFGFLDCYFHDQRTNETLYWPGYTEKRRKGEPIGAGKMIKAELLDKMNWRPFVETINMSLDYYYTKRVQQITDNIKLTSMKDLKDFYIVDIKSDGNMNSFKKIKNINNIEECSNLWKDHTHL